MQCRMESSTLKLDKLDRFPPKITNAKTENLLSGKTLRTLRACHRRRFSTVLHSRTERFIFRLINWGYGFTVLFGRTENQTCEEIENIQILFFYFLKHCKLTALIRSDLVHELSKAIRIRFPRFSIGND